VTLDVADDVPIAVATDEPRLRQVLLNLVGNAAKFTHQGSISLVITRSGQDEFALAVATPASGSTPETWIGSSSRSNTLPRQAPSEAPDSASRSPSGSSSCSAAGSTSPRNPAAAAPSP